MTLLELLQLVRKHLRLVIALPIACAVVMGVVSFVGMSNTYAASVSMYVLTLSSENQSSLSTDLSASQMLANDVAELIQSDRILTQTASALNMQETELAEYDLQVTSSTTTRLITLTVTGENASAAAAIANGIATTTDEVAQEIMDIEAINVIDKAAVPDAPSGPPRMMYTAVAFLAGLFLAIAIVVLMDMLNMRVRKPEEIEELLGVPVIGRIPTIKR